MEIKRIELNNEITSIGCFLERFFGRLLLVELGFDKETIIFNLGNFNIYLDRNFFFSRRVEQHTHFPKIVDKTAKYLMP